MKIYHNILDYQAQSKSIVTVGMFDGLHVGHQKILSTIHQLAFQSQSEFVVITFSPHPRFVLKKETDLQLIYTDEEKIGLFEKMGVSHLIIHPFTETFANLSTKEFVENYLVNKLQMQAIVIGYDHHFGKNREGSYQSLESLGNELGFKVYETDAVKIKDEVVSSTLTRKYIQEGKIELANQFLGFNYQLQGVVIEGKKIGRTIGFPTANLELTTNTKVIPKKGVYAVKIHLQQETYFGMMNIGDNPTISEKNSKQLNIEVNIFNFKKDIYGEKITISLYSFLREERRFSSIDTLKDQILKDQIQTYKYFEL